tara:strand:+ start:266 stop:1033 length:768 start_codon:yes stop_codon:yes gene_type:complete
MPTFKKNPNSIMKRSGFKMKSSPTKGKLDDFFSSLGREATETRQAKQREENEGGLTNFEKRRAEKKSRKAGESKFQADVRRGKERRAKEKAAKAVTPKKKSQTDLTKKNKSVVEIPTSFEDSNKGQFLKESLTLTPPPPPPPPPKIETTIKKDTRPPGTSDSYMRKHKTGKYAKSGVTPSNGSTGKVFTVHNPGKTQKAGRKQFGVNTPQSYSFTTKEEADAYIAENKGSFLKRSGFKMKKSPAKNYKKGYYGVK